MKKWTEFFSKTTKTSIILLVAVLLAACILEPELEPEKEETYLDIDEIVELKLGERKIGQPSGLEVGFEKVVSDSRCPLNVKCFWQGIAEIQVSLKFPNEKRQYFILDTYRHPTVDTLGYRLKLLQLDPYPEYQTEPDISGYSATILIKKNEENKNE